MKSMLVTLLFTHIILGVYFQTRNCFMSVAKFNIYTKLLKNALFPPLTEQYGFFELGFLENRDDALAVCADLITGRTWVSGGPLLRNVYKLYYVKMNYNSSVTGTSGISINGKGTPVCVDSFFYNSKYGTFPKAGQKDDGILIIRESVKVKAGTNNTLFSIFEPYLTKVKTPGSRVLISKWITLWYKNIFANPFNYYMYRGLFSFDVNENEPAYNYATVLVRPFEQSPTISNQQFTSFHNLLNHFNRPMVSCGTVDFGQPPSDVYNINGPRIEKPTA